MATVLIRRALAAALLAASAAAFAQPYPNKTIRIVVPFPPAGGVDIVGRSLAEKFQASLKQTVIVDNKPGAGTTIGTEAVAKAAPDGYTLLVGPIGGQAIVGLMLTKIAFDMRKDFAPVSRVGYGTVAFVVPAGSPAKSVQEFVALAKAQPGRLTFASSGTGALIHLTGEMFKLAAAINLTHVPYKGTTQILPDILDGRVDMALDSLPAYLPHLKSGKLRALAVASRTRSSVVPELPTMGEVGYPGVISATDYAVFAPAGTPKDVITLLNREVAAALQAPDLRAKFATLGIEPSASTPEALQAELLEEFAKWGRVIREANIKPE